MKRLLAFICLFMLICSVHAEQPIGMPKSKAQFSALLSKAKSGDVYSKYVVAYCYMGGVDGIVGKKYSKGKKMLQEAADAGCADACRLMYKLEPSKEYYRERAVAIYKKQNTGDAYYKIANMYSNDRGVCLRWLKTSMDYGYSKAMSDLLTMYKNERNRQESSFDAWCNSITPYSRAAKEKDDNVSPMVNIDDLDTNIPESNKKNSRTIAVIFGNEHYQMVENVPFAENDANIFAAYCEKTLGIPGINIRKYSDASYAMMVTAITDVRNIVEAYQGNMNVIFYYAGHGIPNEQTLEAFLLPVDTDGKNTEICYSLNKLYSELNSLGANQVFVFLDACFSGTRRGEGMIASARGVARKAKRLEPQGKMIVVSASTGDETAYPYKEKEHGMFSYFLMKKLQESTGNCTLGELFDYVKTNVRQCSILNNRKSQTPDVLPSASLGDSWKDLKLK